MKKEPNAITISKTRYQFYDEVIGEILAIDIFSKELSGLAYLEIEFASREEAERFSEPDWIITDVTALKEYKNGSLAKHGIPPGMADINK